jgi:hypothetical protein
MKNLRSNKLNRQYEINLQIIYDVMDHIFILIF